MLQKLGGKISIICQLKYAVMLTGRYILESTGPTSNISRYFVRRLVKESEGFIVFHYQIITYYMYY